MAAKPPQEAPPPETLKYQTWVFKVLIHCDGCTKRVKKILQGIDGVYTAEIDSQQHKVTVTGNVEAETIIKKLSRSGKSVELWPVQKAAAEKKKDKKSEKSKGEKTEDNNIVNKEKEDQPINEGCIDDDDEGGEDSVSDKEGHGNNNEREGGAGGNTGGESSKKKKKKKKKSKGGQNGNSGPPNGVGKEISTDNTVDDAPEKMGTTNSKEIIKPPNMYYSPPQIPPPPQYQIPNMYYSPPPQIPHPPPPPPQAPYGLSYNINTSYPISNASYYVGAPIMPMHAYTDSYNHLPPPSNLINGRDYGDDEYEGGGYCSIM